MVKLKCNIEKYISDSGLKKGFIANKLEISTRQLRNYERGKSYPPADKLFFWLSYWGYQLMTYTNGLRKNKDFN